jgi:hypothetical protein
MDRRQMGRTRTEPHMSSSKAFIIVTLDCHCGWQYRGRSLYYSNEAYKTHRVYCQGKPHNDLPATT